MRHRKPPGEINIESLGWGALKGKSCIRSLSCFCGQMPEFKREGLTIQRNAVHRGREGAVTTTKGRLAGHNPRQSGSRKSR